MAAHHHGNITHAQLLAAGLTAAEIDRRVARGWLVRRHHGVYALGHVPRSRASRWHAATLAHDAPLSHRAAAAHWNALSGAVPTELIVTPVRHHRAPGGVILHRSTLAPGDVTVRDGIPVTTPLRTMLDVAAVLDGRPLARVFEQLQVLHGLAPVPVAVAVLARPRARGNGRLRALLVDAVDPAAVRSVLELRFLKLCAAHGVPRPLVNEPVGVWTPDFLWPAAGLVVETDGVDFHRTAAARARDARKDRELRALGLEVVRLTWADVVHDGPRTAARVHAALAARRHERVLNPGMGG